MYGDTNYGRRGLMKLMLRMPALRGQLQILAARDEHFLNLCGAFEEASITLDTLTSELHGKKTPRLVEYEKLCLEIETEVIAICYQNAKAEGVPH